MPPVAEVAATVPERHYTHHEGRGPTPHRSNPAVIHRELTSLEVAEGMRVMEIGTGSGYSGALLANLVGASGAVTSVDIDPYLTRWANAIHQERGVENVDCFTGDGTAGHPERASYDRLVAWCTPTLLPDAWIDQLANAGVIVTPLPIAAVPNLTVVAKIRVADGQPRVEAIFHGGYIEATASVRTDFTMPGRWVDWEYRVPEQTWISIAWRDTDDWRGTGARIVLDQLRNPGYAAPYAGERIDWPSWRTWVAATSDQNLTMAGLTPDLCAIGHSTQKSAAVIQQDGMILADKPDSQSLTILRDWLAGWEAAGRPAPETYQATLARTDNGDTGGWDLQLSQ
ncbi:protein-L-isoaspartate O-methyltransferase family protein [Streptomyces sp. WZ-12]|uniref:protein-L-isoaspartate O-methyltransferase family protein n=1 Tax=Streptomyces sp. WZ-12 TaxID=3030210 RepID=UPI002380E279|nr:methyltransferase domain-containing protein [Streptomyces sp. WZ-12]